MADGNISMGQRSYNNLTRDQHNEQASLSFGGGVVDDGGMRVQSDGSGGQIITEHQDQMAVNYRASDSTNSSINTNLSNSKSNLASLTDRESEQTSIVSAENLDVARNIASGSTTASNLSLSDVNALKTGFAVEKATNQTNSVSDGKSTGTNAHLTSKVPGAISAVTGIDGGASTTAANTHDFREDMSIQDRQAFNTAMDKVKTAAKTDSLTTNNTDETRLNKSFSSNLSTQEQIATDKAKTQQDVDTYSKQLSYVQANSGTIDRNANNDVMQAVMEKHPELQSKEQAARWMKSHRTEADAIAQPIISNYNPFKSPETAAKVEQLQQNTPDVKNMTIAAPESLKQKHQEATTTLEETAVVKDATGVTKPITTVVEDAAKISNLEYNKPVEKVLEANLTEKEQVAVQKLKFEKDKGKKSVAQIVTDQVNNGIKHSKTLAGKSAALRLVEEIGDTSAAVLKSAGLNPDPDKKNKK